MSRQLEQASSTRALALGPLDFRAITEHEIRRCRRDGADLSVVIVRIIPRSEQEPGFEERSRLHGFAELVANKLRASDVVALTGPDELALLLPDTGPEGVPVVLDHLNSLLQELTKLQQPDCVTRLGWSTADPRDPDWTFLQLMRAAGSAIASARHEQPDITALA